MRTRWGLPLATLLLFVGVCGGCLWLGIERPRFSQHFDIGGGRTLTVWSASRNAGLQGLIEFEPGPSPLMVWYRIDAGDREVIHTMFLEHDDKGEYEFRMVSADGGRLICVYEVTRAAKSYYYLLIYDATTDESWPRTWADRGGDLDQAAAKWRERYRRLKAENPELPTPKLFAE